jgi:hypothetical protein
VKPTIEGVVLPPSALAITTGSPPSITATHEFVVPKSIPMTVAMTASSLFLLGFIVDLAQEKQGVYQEGRKFARG